MFFENESMKRKAFPSKLREIKVSYCSNLPPVKDRVQIRSSKDAFEVLMANWDENLIEYREEFKVLYLNRANHVLGLNTYSIGSAAGTLVCTRQILAVALKSNSSGIILSHNHPSGNSSPSSADRDITKRMKQAAEYMELSLLDHIIITKDSYYSFADEGEL